MVNPSRQRVECGHAVTVTLLDGNRASVFVQRPQGGCEHSVFVDLAPLIAGGLSGAEAIQHVLEIVAVGVRCADRKNG